MTAEELCDALPLCGCGDPEEGAQWLLVLLQNLTQPQGERTYAERMDRLAQFETMLPNAGAQMVVLGMLDREGWTEHGSSINYSWLTPKGEAIRDGLAEIDAQGEEGWALLFDPHGTRGDA